MNVIAKFSFVAVLAVMCAACSQSQNPLQAPAPAASVQSSARAIPMAAPGSSGLADVAPPENGPTLARLMQRPAFAKTFEAMDGASQLPAWVRQGGVETPSQKVQVGGKTLWLAHACESSQCDNAELWLLIDTGSHTTQGLFEDEAGQKGATVEKLVWLGKPDATVQTFLKEHIAED